MKLQHQVCLFIFLFFLSKEIVAQEKPLAFTLITGNQNVSVGKINGITQDKWGYMWFADNGNRYLIRYDGYRMDTYKHNPSDSNSINISDFECIAADSLGNVWFPVDGGVDKINSITGVATHYTLKAGVGAIIVDHLGFVWLGTGDGLYQLDPKTGKSILYPHDEYNSTTLSNGDIRVIYEDREGTIWVGNGLPFVPGEDGGLNKFNRATGKFTRYLHNPKDPYSLINNRVRAIFEDSKGTFWVGTQGDGLHIMNRKTGTFERLSYDSSHPEKLSRPPMKRPWDHITFINEDIAGNMWIGTYDQGLVKYDPITKKITHFIGDKTTLNGFTDSTSWCAFTSRDGTLWISTEASNLYRVDPFRKSITTISTGSGASSFLEDKEGYLWVGTDGNGIFKFDQNKKAVQHFKHNPLDRSGLSEDHVMIHVLLNDDHKILAENHNGLNVLDARTNQFQRFSDDKVFKDSADYGGFVDVIQDRNGIDWFACWGRGLIRYDPKDKSVKQFLADPKDSNSISTNNLNHIIEDKAARLWIIGQDGINNLNRQTGRFKHYLPGTFIGSIYEDSKNNIWAGTVKGLYCYDEKKDSFYAFFDPYSEFSATAVGSIIEDNNQNLWLNSYSAIIKLNLLTSEVFVYRDKFGINLNTMSPWEKAYKDKNGQLFFGYGDGFCFFYPQELAIKTNFKISITDFFINTIRELPGKHSISQKPVEELSDLDLKYNQTSVGFNFSAFDYRDPESIQYFTKLEGYDNIWREAKDEKNSRYFNLPRGKYIYHIKAFNRDGTRAEKTITFTIHPPWWQTWWAYTLYVALLVFLIWGFIKWRTSALQKEKDLLENKVTIRTKELKDEKDIVESTLIALKSTQSLLIHSEKMASLGELTAGIAHEIQNPLNFVNNFSDLNTELVNELKEELKAGNFEEANDIADDIKSNNEKINNHGKRAESIVTGMLQHSRTSTGQKEPTDINKLADEYLRLAYHGIRAKEKDFNCEIVTSFDETIGTINIIPQEIGRVILNLVNNAFYAVNEKTKMNSEGYKSTVSVITKKSGDSIELTATDNGNGIPKKIVDKIFQPFFTTKPTGQGTGLGLSLSYDIIKAHGGGIKVETKEGEGSEFVIQLPVK